MVSAAKLVKGLKIAGLWVVILFSALVCMIGVIAFFLSAINDQPDGGVMGFILAVLGWKMVFWLLTPLVELTENNESGHP